ncbi:hypothetical protein ACFT9M_12735 [Micromonospora purpureochromogenes]|uniref:hypothetical protein n=1 Tax=Micromonospora purpureochromogenes TaxID=47872 RepID=UPI00362EFFB7
MPARAAGVRHGFDLAELAHLIVPAVRALATEHPAIEPRIVELEGESALRELTTGTVDVLIDDSEPGSVPQPAGTESVALLSDPYREPRRPSRSR